MMKKVLLASVLASTLASAQINLKSTRFGVTAGGNFSSVRNAHNPSGPRFTFQAGALAMIPIESTNQFFIQPEVTFYGAGETGRDKSIKGREGYGYDAVYANNYLSVPIYVKGYFSSSESEFFALAGPRFNFLLSQNVRNVPISRPYYDPNVTDPKYPEISGKANKFNFGIGIGAGYSYKRQLEFMVKYDFGISNTYPKLNESWTKDPLTKKRKSEQVISLGVNYIFK